MTTMLVERVNSDAMLRSVPFDVTTSALAQCEIPVLATPAAAPAAAAFCPGFAAGFKAAAAGAGAFLAGFSFGQAIGKG